MPNAVIDGLAANCPFATAVPESGTLTLASEALLAIVSVPLKVPAAPGANLRLNVVLAPAATVEGTLGDISVKELLDVFALLIVTLCDPRFVAVRLSVLVVPAVMLPKFTPALPSERLPGCCC